MGAETGTDQSRRGRSGRHRRRPGALIERRDHSPTRPSRSLPAPSPSALVGLAVLVLIGFGVVHLSGSGSAVPLEDAPTVQQPSPGDESGSPTAGAARADSSTGEAGTDDGPSSAGSAPSAAAGDGEQDTEAAEIVVHVSGAVAAPGLVRLPPGSRIDDALRAAGGALEDADLSAINLARPLVDGEQIHVPVPGEEPRPDAAAAPAQEGAAAGSTGPGDAARIDLNTANAAELEELPGVGPAIAERIVEHRERNGPFTSVEGLLEVSGIGPATLEEIREQATV
ncbi:competence protein ComEA [Brachybacterium ginsengisoli]|uniref:Competence protein ComEA n=1 Tax=Brachybacterium ginsengisoli TaxID=1331682 RepID=A0A291GXA0_9MICO|nr:ComEA family DNA-binding protein [Brachybacterium ginsengisoli]ATG54724.1 competence protein ComEA [Brachybacterium ginsengisoli]